MKEQSQEDIKLGRFLSLVLRHQPEAAGITLDAFGWADVNTLLAGVSQTGYNIDRTILERIVRDNVKQRYTFNEDHSKIRANQGHSIDVDLELKSLQPPDLLFHGTAQRILPAIQEKGICAMKRQYVHLSKDEETAFQVGKRHGTPVVLAVDAASMYQNGFLFYCSKNGVWLCHHVPWSYVTQRKSI